MCSELKVNDIISISDYKIYYKIALAIRNEVEDLNKEGINVIPIDIFLSEMLPLGCSEGLPMDLCVESSFQLYNLLFLFKFMNL